MNLGSFDSTVSLPRCVKGSHFLTPSLWVLCDCGTDNRRFQDRWLGFLRGIFFRLAK